MERVHSIDYVKGISIFIVVAFHVMTFDGNDMHGGEWLFFSFPRFIISFFFIVAGFLFGYKMKESPHPGKYFKKYIFTLVKFYVGWHMLYMIYDISIRILYGLYKGHDIKAVLGHSVSIASIWNMIYYGSDGGSSYHMWYLSALIWSIAVVFLFIKWKKLTLLLMASLFLNLLGLFGQAYSGIFDLPAETRDTLFFGLFYTSLGCFIAIHYTKMMNMIYRIKSIVLFLIMILSILIQWGENYIAISVFGGTPMMAHYYLSTVPLTISLLLLLLKHHHFGKGTLFALLGRNVFGVYLAHMLFISLFVLVFHFFDVSWLRQYMGINIFLTMGIIFISHVFYMYTNWIWARARSFVGTVFSRKRKPDSMLKRGYEY